MGACLRLCAPVSACCTCLRLSARLSAPVYTYLHPIYAYLRLSTHLSTGLRGLQSGLCANTCLWEVLARSNTCLREVLAQRSNTCLREVLERANTWLA